MNKVVEWFKKASGDKKEVLFVMQDLEDRGYFPVYFDNMSQADSYRNNIISESKLKIVSVYYLTV